MISAIRRHAFRLIDVEFRLGLRGSAERNDDHRAEIVATFSFRSGIGGFETTLHLTGDYPEWWEGRRFDHPIEAWVAGETRRPRVTLSS
jgi:hypothetical protein